MKNPILLPMIALSMVIYSCKNEALNERTSDLQHQKDLEVEIVQVKENLMYADMLHPVDDREFIQGEYLQRLSNLKLQRVTKSGENENDTVFSAEEIPVVRVESINQKIFSDGSGEFVTEDITSEEDLFLEKIILNPLTDEEKVAKTVYADGTVTLYNTNGSVLSSHAIEPIDYSPMLDSLKLYLQEAEADAVNTKTISHRRTRAMASAKEEGMKLLYEGADFVQLEMEMKPSPSIIPGMTRYSVRKRAVMTFAPDMSHMFSQRIYEGNQLTEVISIQYEDDLEAKSASYSGKTRSLLPAVGIKQVNHKSLFFKEDGTPMVSHSVESYYSNKVTYHFMEK